MQTVILWILRILPKGLASYLLKKFPTVFFKNERIIRVIHSNKINPNNKILKNNFFKFEQNSQSNKYELSKVRFELETVEFCRELGNSHIGTGVNITYYGFACAYVHSIRNVGDDSIKLTPDLFSNPKNYFHTDIYDERPSFPVENGQAKPAEINLRLDEFKRIWKVFKDDPDLSKNDIRFKIYQSANPISA